MAKHAFLSFLAEIKSPELLRVAGHWGFVRSGRLMPRWSDLDPSAIKPELGFIWAWRYDAADKHFVGRLAGETIVELFGKTIRGVKMEDIYPPDKYREPYERNLRVVEGPCFARDHGCVFKNEFGR